VAQCQCSVPEAKIQSPICSKPTDAKVNTITCSEMQVQWKGSAGQTYEVDASFRDAATNKLIKSITVSNIASENDGYYSATIEVIEGSKASWSIEAICSNADRNFYSYALRGKDVLVPSCKELSDNTSKTIYVYPNPSTGNIAVEYISPGSGNVQFTIYNLMGKAVFAKTEHADKGVSNTYSFTLFDLSAGIYLLEARNGNEISQTKFVIEK
jgi:hypothetical protein